MRQPAGAASTAARFNILTLDGKLLARWGSDDMWQPGNFYAPHGLWGDPEGTFM